MPLFAVIGDIHEEFARLQTVVDWLRDRTQTGILQSGSDLAGVLLVGDIAEAGFTGADPPGREQRWREKVDKVLGMVRTLGAPVVWVPGNHDQRGYEAEPGNADGRLIELAGVRIVGIGGAGPKSWGFRYEWTDDDIRKLELPECDILLSHTPPLDTALDCSNSGMSGGSAAILERAKKHRGVLLCGHIHEAFGTERIRNCFGYNAGSLGNPYGATRIGMLDWDAQRGRVTITHYNLDINDEEQVEFKLPARAT